MLSKNCSYKFYLFITFFIASICYADKEEINNYEAKKKSLLIFNIISTKGHLAIEGRYLALERRNALMEMKGNGDEIADLALDLYNFLGGVERGNTSAENKLEKLARENNPRFQCLFVEYWNRYELSEQKKLEWDKYVASASDAKIPYCMEINSLHLLKEKPLLKLNLEHEAAMLGDMRAQFLMSRRYYKGDGIEKNMDKAYCWDKEFRKTSLESYGVEGGDQTMRYFYKKEVGKNPELVLTSEDCKVLNRNL
jgi:hypothetical protein